MSDLREKLAEAMLQDLLPGRLNDISLCDSADFCADRIAKLVEGGWILHHPRCKSPMSYEKRWEGGKEMAYRWFDGDESTCTCGLAEALGMRKEK